MTVDDLKPIRVDVPADVEEIHLLMQQVAELTGATAGHHTTLPEDDLVGSITAWTDPTGFNAGKLILTVDRRVFWQHPGYPGDYVRSEGATTDLPVEARVRAVLAGGSRKRTVPGDPPVEYEVIVNGTWIRNGE